MSKCSECKGTAQVYGAKCGFCFGTGKTQRGLTEGQHRFLSHKTCICGAFDEGLQSHAMDCPWGYEYRSVFGKKTQYSDKKSLGSGNSMKKKAGG